MMLLRSARSLASKALSVPRTFTRSYHAPLREMNFLVQDVYNLPEHYKTLKEQDGASADAESLEMMMEAMAGFCENSLGPLNEVGDQVGCKYVDEKTVISPPGFKEAYEEYCQSGWQGISYPEKYGGQNLPQSVALAVLDMAATANWTWTMFPGLSKGCINTVLAHGTEELKEAYAHKLIAGEWTGTMCLTEPQCGSDLAQVSTKAEPNEDGSFNVTGTKIFISCGDHDMAENIVHCVLARLPGAPEGTRGISLFLVPKFLPEADGTVDQDNSYNNTNIGRIEHKMGCHGSPTCEINFENSKGWLIGTENRGLNHMFTFINTSRIGTAVQGVAGAENSFQNSLAYAKDRLAMRALSGPVNPDGVADPIISHPAVRHMLLFQKAIAEGGRSMVFECGKLQDSMHDLELAGDSAGAKKYDDQLGFLTPILKGFLSESGVEASNMGIQVFGGHGYIQSNKQEQIARDVRISALWEGTTQIQALDLLGRKIMLQKLKPINDHCARVRAVCQPLFFKSGGIGRRARQLLTKSIEWQVLTYRIAMEARKDRDFIGSASVDYLMYSGYCNLALHWLIMEQKASELLNDPNAREAPGFYQAKIETSEFVFEHLLPRTKTLKTTMMAPLKTLMQMDVDRFSYDYHQ